MKFEERKLEDCLGWQLAHSVTGADRKFNKATEVTRDMIDHLQSGETKTLQVYQLEPGDLDEDQAAEKAAKLISGSGLVVQKAGRGRANVIAEHDGVFIPSDAVDQLNALDDAFSAASKGPFSKVQKGELVSTIKIVPYGLPGKILSSLSLLEKMRVTKFSPFSASLLVGGAALPPKVLNTLEARLHAVGGKLVETVHLRHTSEEYAEAIKSNKSDLILMLGVSAISDERDVLPEAVRTAGGSVVKVGLPTDPGNLLMFARKDTQTIIGLPGCARSPALNGFDWVLERFAAGLPVDAKTLAGFGTGGLLKEPADRSFPRRRRVGKNNRTAPIAAAILLAAGRSTRSGDAHKLLSLVDDKSVIEHSAEVIAKAGITGTAVVTGNIHEKIEQLLAGSNVVLVHNADFALGMGTSIAAGAKWLNQACEFALIYLGDMPFVQPSTIKALIDSAKDAPPSSIHIPTFNGKRGHPVLWGQRHFKALSQLKSDVGGREIIRENSEKVVEVAVNDPGILIDLDTPEMLKQFGITPTIR
ncbi:MAG: NTP transferase domain-containing protein [Kordiimonadaceae bacterium]|nr:NTP transferase domain-containing protein [Kordiimonadaceae bacterium]MBO6570544.1 NTP transferase domain-containing protein [Kordiimonadaceae bacterium]MBO6966337.1 NTP transferase domain-containing protein [Kordiimonadaceae bacterium]